MRSFIIKTALFITPFFLLYGVNAFFYDKNEGGLTRIGFMYGNPLPMSSVNQRFSIEKKYKSVSELSDKTKTSYDAFIIGDSFSKQDSLGYKNYLANKNTSVLYMDSHLTGRNPVQKLVNLVNGGFTDSLQVDYVVLQSVERAIVWRCKNIDFDESTQFNYLKKTSDKDKPKTKNRKKKPKTNFFTDAIFKIPLTNLLYSFTPKPLDSQTYKVRASSKELFTGGPEHILFYEGDIHALSLNNDVQKIENTNQVLNKVNKLLLEKGVKLVVLIAPDKYDLYYPYIAEGYDLDEPLFFNYFDQLEKNYLYVPSKKVLSESIKNNKDVYFYDDSHWSPLAAEIIAKEIKN